MERLPEQVAACQVARPQSNRIFAGVQEASNRNRACALDRHRCCQPLFEPLEYKITSAMALKSSYRAEKPLIGMRALEHISPEVVEERLRQKSGGKARIVAGKNASTSIDVAPDGFHEIRFDGSKSFQQRPSKPITMVEPDIVSGTLIEDSFSSVKTTSPRPLP